MLEKQADDNRSVGGDVSERSGLRQEGEGEGLQGQYKTRLETAGKNRQVKTEKMFAFIFAMCYIV